MTIEVSLARFGSGRSTPIYRSVRPSLARRLELRARRRRRIESNRRPDAPG